MPEMSRTKILKGHCTHCGGLLEFPVESTGMTTDCPLCGQQTELLLDRPVEEPTIPRKTIVWTIIAVLILGGGLAAALVALKGVQRLAMSQNKHPAATTAPGETNAPTTLDPAIGNGLQASTVTIEKVPGGSLVYAVGTLTNASPRQRFGVRVELDLLDANGQKIGTASDYQGVMEPNSQWQFKALVVDPKPTVSARIAGIKEQP